MNELNVNPAVRLGNRLYPVRRLLFLIPAFVLMINVSDLHYPLNEYFYDELIEIVGFLIVSAGLFLRFWISGTSRRVVTKKRNETKHYIRQSGFYRTCRSPYVIPDFLIVLGLSIPLINLVLLLLSFSIYALLYIPIVFSRETILQYQYSKEYLSYCKDVRLIFPSLGRLNKNLPKFRFLYAFHKEGSVVATIGILYFCIEQFREFVIRGDWVFSPIWVSMLVPFFAICLIQRIFDRAVEVLPEDTHWADLD